MCPICKSEYFELIGKPRLDKKSKEIIRKDYKVVQCKKCEFYYILPTIDFSEDEWGILYGKEYFNECTGWHKKKRAKDRNIRLFNLEKFCQHKIEKFLDIGCGEGEMLIDALNNGWVTYGIDISDNRIDPAKNENINFFKSDLINASFPDNFFDIIYCDSILEHVLNPMEYLLEIARILKHSGIVYIGVPNEDCLTNDIKKIVNFAKGNKELTSKIKPFISPYHIGGFNKNSLSFAVKRVNLETKLLRNFATRLLFMQERFFSLEFFRVLPLSFICFAAIPLRKEYYLEIYAVKPGNVIND